MTTPNDSADAAPRVTGSPSVKTPLLVALVTSVLVTIVSLVFPAGGFQLRFFHVDAATGVGVVFLAATYLFVLRRDEATIRAHGLSLGGLLEPAPISARRLARDTLTALAYAVLLAAIFFPPFFFGFKSWFHLSHRFVISVPKSPLDEIAGQLVVIALPEEAFFRGYLQSALDRAWPPRWRILGADLGWGWLASAAIFAVGHVLTIRHPARLAVFFPALLFGWLRARTKGIGAGVLFHASCNLFSAALARGFGLGV